MREFRGLVVDDSQKALDRLTAICDSKEVDIEGKKVRIKILPELDFVVKRNDTYEFDNKTFSLLQKHSQEIFDLILLDFGFRKKNVNPREEAETFVIEDRRFFDSKLLSPQTLGIECKKRLYEWKSLKQVEKNFLLVGMLCTDIGLFIRLLSSWTIDFMRLSQITSSVVMPVTSLVIISVIVAIFLKRHEEKFVKSE